MMQYVLGFVFNESKDRVLLLRKARPPWQAGRFNGVGGKIKDGEDPIDSMVRECKEKIGLYIPVFQRVCTMTKYGHWECVVYCASINDDDFAAARQCEDEPLFRIDIAQIPQHALYNLNWLIPLCLDRERAPYSVYAEVYPVTMGEQCLESK